MILSGACLVGCWLSVTSRRMAAEGEVFLQTLEAPPSAEEGEIMVETADGKGVPLVKQDAQRLLPFEDKAQRPGNRRMATLACVYSVDRFVRTPSEIVSMLFRDPIPTLDELASESRPESQHKRYFARLPSLVEGLGDELVSGSIQALAWAAKEVSLRRRTDQVLVRLMDGQHSQWSDAEACRDDLPDTHCVDILDILHVASYVWKAAKALCSSVAEQKEFARERLFRILSGEVAGVIRGLKQISTRRQLSSENFATQPAKWRDELSEVRSHPNAT